MNAARKPKVLVVDDDHMTTDTLAAILVLQEYEAHATYSGESALEWVTQFQPDIVLMDVRMRKLSGVETAARVRELHPECRVILFTASQLNPIERQTIERLHLEFIERPLHPAELLARLKS
jgi:two-component system, NtrC family, phosphoglycerate transport system response regulator PgtA